MFPNLETVIQILDKFLPFALSEGWDNSGLQVGHRSQIIKKVLIALDPTIDAVKKASSLNAQLLLTHHPLIFKTLSYIDSNNYPGDVIVEAIKDNISIIAVHTNFDAAKEGINHILSKRFDLIETEVLEPKEFGNEKGYGLGAIGNLKGSEDLLSFAEKVKKIFNLKTVRITGRDDAEISRVAIVGGSGGGMIPLASERGADLLITGDIGHHDALTAESLGINIIDAGHFSTERTALILFVKTLDEIFRKENMGINLEIYREEKNPIRVI